MKTRSLLISLICSFFLLAGCKPNGEEERVITAVSPQIATANALSTAIVASSEPPLDFARLSQEIDEAESRWQSHNIAKYSFEIAYRQPTWNTQRLTIVVENGLVIDVKQTCFPERDCVVQEIDPTTMIFAPLFTTARQVVALLDPQTEITFNQSYGYPNAIIYEDASWVISAFEILEE